MTTASRPSASRRSSMSVYVSGTSNRSASARALGRSLSQIASNRTPRIFDSTGRCATCAIAPAPTTPMPMGAVRPSTVMCGSLDRANGGAGIVGAKDRAEILSRTRAADGAALAHADAVSVATTTQRESLHAVAPRCDVDGKIGAVQQLATRKAQRRASLVAAERPPPPIRVHRQRADASTRRDRRHRNIRHGAHPSCPAGKIPHVASDELAELVAADDTRPPESRRLVAVESVRTGNLIAHALEVRLGRRAP